MRVTLLALVPLACLAQEDGALSSYKTKILDLNFKVVDMNTNVEELQVKETANDVRLEVAADVLFDFDKAVIKPQAEAKLRQVAALIRDRGKGKIGIQGHTDAQGSDSYNQKLSLQRAEAVRDWIAEKGGIDRARITVQGMGGKKPIAPNTRPDGTDDPTGRQRNRRVELIISK
jgi:outer membrane protein OmpA-like peptidoglycan-associated protein